MSANPRFSGGNQISPPLTITNVQMTDAGNYECEASDASSTVRTQNIQVSPIRMFLQLIVIFMIFSFRNVFVFVYTPRSCLENKNQDSSTCKHILKSKHL